jgi:hypothetical protein
MLRVYFSHHKAASSWLRRLLVELGTALCLDVRHLDIPKSYAPYPTVREMLDAQRPDLIMLNDHGPQIIDTLPQPILGFRVIRDPRDIIVSGYYSHRNSHPTDWDGFHWAELAVHRRALLGLNRDDGLLAEMEFSGPRFISKLAEWELDPRDVLSVRLEDFLAAPTYWWTGILTELDLLDSSPWQRSPLAMTAVRWNLAGRQGWPVQWPATLAGRYARYLPRLPLRRVPGGYVPWSLERNSFDRLTGGRLPGEEDASHHYRHGLAGDWRSHFTDEHVAEFRRMFGDLAERLGYSWLCSPC